MYKVEKGGRHQLSKILFPFFHENYILVVVLSPFYFVSNEILAAVGKSE